MPEMSPVYSSHVEAVGYDPLLQELHVQWNTGKVSVYHGVPPEVGADLHKRASVGEALKEIKGRYRHEYR